MPRAPQKTTKRTPRRGRRPKSEPIETDAPVETEADSPLVKVEDIDPVGSGTSVDDSVFEGAPDIPKKKDPDPPARSRKAVAQA